MNTGDELALEAVEAGGPDASRERSARLRGLLEAELERGERELWERRSGYPDPLAIGLAPDEGRLLAALPLAPELRADPDAVSARGGAVAALVVEKLVEAAAPGRPRSSGELLLLAGGLGPFLALAYPVARAAEAAEYAKLALDDALERMDRLRARAIVLPGHVLDGVEDLRPPIGPTHPLRVAEAVARLGGSPLDDESVEALEEDVLELLDPGGGTVQPHDDPDPARRASRRILRRLDGMGKWGGYHTEFDHLARGFAGHERALAYDVGEALVEAGLLRQKRSVGQRHVCLNPRRVRDIRRLIDEGEPPPGLALPSP